MTYLKGIIAAILFSTLGLLYLQTKMQDKKIDRLTMQIDTLRIEAELQKIGAKGEGEIEALLREFQRDEDEEANDSTDGIFSVDFDGLF